MKTYTNNELVEALRLHGMWLRGEGGGVRADLSRANLSRADLYETVLDPAREPNGICEGYERDGDFIIGYRSRKAGHIDQYRDGRYYSADVFSVCPTTACHPGLYLCPTVEVAGQQSTHPDSPIIKVRTKPSEIHHAGGKWRCRWFYVLTPEEGQSV